MIENIFLIFILVVVVEATTEIIVESEFPLFHWFRNRLSKIVYPAIPGDREPSAALIALHKLVTCGYCFSVWTSAVFAFFAPSVFSNSVLNWFVFTFVLHRLSNWLHVIYELVKKGRVLTVDLELKNVGPEYEEPAEDDEPGGEPWKP